MQSLIEAGVAVGCPPDQIQRFIRARYIPLPWQLKLHAAARECDMPGGPDQVGVGGSRGPGKSHGILAQVAIDDCDRFPGVKCLYLRKIATKASEQFDDLRRKVLAHVPHAYKATKGMVLFPNGSRIITGHFKDEKDVDNYLGMEYDIIAIEEATTLSATKYQTLRDSNRSSVPGFRPRIYNSTNPGGIGHTWYKNRFVDPYRNGEQKWTRFIPATLDDNSFVDPDYKRKVEENVGWKLRAYRYGDWDIAAGQFFVTWRHDIHVIRPFPIPRSWPVWAGFDYGYSHPTSAHLLAVDGDGCVYVVGEYHRARTTVRENARGLKKMLAEIMVDDTGPEDKQQVIAKGVLLAQVWPWAAGVDVFARRGDSSGKTIAEQYADEGINLSRADVDRINGAAEVLRRLGDVDADPLVPPSLYVFSTCRKLIDTVPAMQFDPKNAEDVLKVDVDEDGLGGDDCYDAIRYGCMAKGVGATGSEVVAQADAMDQYDNQAWGQVESEYVRSDYIDDTVGDYFERRRSIYRV